MVIDKRRTVFVPAGRLRCTVVVVVGAVVVPSRYSILVLVRDRRRQCLAARLQEHEQQEDRPLPQHCADEELASTKGPQHDVSIHRFVV